jgi:hypothetical protein
MKLPPAATQRSDRQGLLYQIVVLHVRRHPVTVKGCEVCHRIGTGRWPE